MGFTIGRLILLSLALLIFFGVAERVLDRMQFIKYYLERRKRWFVALEKKMILLEKA